jgi:Leucine-rich repeat (LRR) protein
MNNRINLLPDLTNARNLEILACAVNQLETLPNLPNVLKILWCGHNQLTRIDKIPDELEQLACGNNQLTDLPDLKNLKMLACNNNQLTNLPSLPNELQILYAEDNQLQSLPHFLPRTLRELHVSGNPFIMPIYVINIPENLERDVELTIMPPKATNENIINNVQNIPSLKEKAMMQLSTSELKRAKTIPGAFPGVIKELPDDEVGGSRRRLTIRKKRGQQRKTKRVKRRPTKK